MEAVAAVGVASAAVQFLDFSVKTLAACKEIRDSSTGSTKANEELNRSVKQLKVMQKTLQQSTHTLSNTYRQLVRAIQDCSRVADELLQLLEYVREVAQKSLGMMRAALRQVREGKRIEKLQTQLSSC
jgi:methyl-accepting chemotaxis protein